MGVKCPRNMRAARTVLAGVGVNGLRLWSSNFVLFCFVLFCFFRFWFTVKAKPLNTWLSTADKTAAFRSARCSLHDVVK